MAAWIKLLNMGLGDSTVEEYSGWYWVPINQRFDGISTTFNLSGGFSRTWSEVMRQGELLSTQYDGATAALGFNTRFTRAVKLDYEASYARSKSRFEGTALRPIDVVRQNAAVDFIVRKKFICRIGGEHYYTPP